MLIKMKIHLYISVLILGITGIKAQYQHNKAIGSASPYQCVPNGNKNKSDQSDLEKAVSPLLKSSGMLQVYVVGNDITLRKANKSQPDRKLNHKRARAGRGLFIDPVRQINTGFGSSYKRLNWYEGKIIYA